MTATVRFWEVTRLWAGDRYSELRTTRHNFRIADNDRFGQRYGVPWGLPACTITG
jgi:hypothetical protein